MRRFNTGGGAAPFSTVERVYNGTPTGDLPVLPTPADLLNRRPGELGPGGGTVTPFRTGKLPPLGNLDPQEFIRLLSDEMEKRVRSYTNFDALRYASFNNVPFTIGVADTVVLQKATDIRVYLFIINTHPVNDLFLTFRTISNAIVGVPISPGRGFFEFNNIVPQDTVHLIANAAGTTGVLLYAELPPSRLLREPGTT